MADDPKRLETAQNLLQEAVFAARGPRARSALAQGGAADAGGCGLGLGPNLDFDAGRAGERLAADLWPGGLADADAARVRAVLRDWVKRQDGLDRKRNHFIKAFRAEHGADRTSWSETVVAEYDAGIESINAENRARLAESARELAKG